MKSKNFFVSYNGNFANNVYVTFRDDILYNHFVMMHNSSIKPLIMQLQYKRHFIDQHTWTSK